MDENVLIFKPQVYKIDSSFFEELYHIKLRKLKQGVNNLSIKSLVTVDGTFLIDKHSFDLNDCRFGEKKEQPLAEFVRYNLEKELLSKNTENTYKNEHCTCRFVQGTLVVFDSLLELRKYDKKSFISSHFDLDSITPDTPLVSSHIFKAIGSGFEEYYYKVNHFFIFCFMDLKSRSGYYYIADPVVTTKCPFPYSYFGIVNNTTYMQSYNNFKLSDLNAILIHFKSNTLSDLFFIYSRMHSRVFRTNEFLYDGINVSLNGETVPLDSVYICSYSSFNGDKYIPKFWRNFLLSFCIENRIFGENLNLVIVNSKLFETDEIYSQALVYCIQTPSEDDFRDLSLVYSFSYHISKGSLSYEYQYSFMDHVDNEKLNLELITWRILPELNLDKILHLKVCIVGLGTLGCSLVRQLLAWGVETFVLVDSGFVTNSTRQSLYTHKYCYTNTPKVDAAERMIFKIKPDCKLTIVNTEIPMIGHTYCDNYLNKQLQNTKAIVASSDVIVLATDSKESRWLPSLISSQMNMRGEKCPLVVSAGLGFDSFMIVRHSYKEFKGSCYFCSESQAPIDTITGRPFDETCTVVKAGITDICASMVVELIVSLTQHEKMFAADHGDKTCIGKTPHSIRFSLSDYKCSELYAEPSEMCICCSENVLNKLKTDEDIIEVFKDPSILMKYSKLDSFIHQLSEYKISEKKEEGYVLL
ncbi:ThiF family protein [Theileria parva strain Muguga]|uniref:ThiF family protein n=1 Tax=Theileria parva strain Muguga TaxID=333668 RepID=UPI001C623E63|nr:ThiF family protein [Theileria parva strain Muguga]KAF5153472.1 ThiF family protein [Theileria parva strain Muguga]